MIKRSNNESGQVLLIIVMILATVLAVTFSVSFTSQTETQTAKLEENSRKSLAAAQAILEASLKNNVGTYSLGDLNLNLAGFTGIATVEATVGPVFITPLIQKDEQYSFYLSQYNNPGFSNPFTGNVYIYMKSESGCPSVELTYIDTSDVLSRDFIDPCNQTSGGLNILSTQPGSSLNGVDFGYRITNPKALSGKKLMLMRVLSNSTKLGIQEVNGNNLPAQGKTTTAQAQTGTSTSSTVSLFQSYPQIPSDFFVASF